MEQSAHYTGFIKKRINTVTTEFQVVQTKELYIHEFLDNLFKFKLEIVLYTLFVLSRPPRLTGLNHTDPSFLPCSSKFTRVI